MGIEGGSPCLGLWLLATGLFEVREGVAAGTKRLCDMGAKRDYLLFVCVKKKLKPKVTLRVTEQCSAEEPRLESSLLTLITPTPQHL